MSRQWLYDRIAALEKENERLKICANCKHHSSTSQWEYDPACFVGEQPEYTDDSENCIHSPSKWEERL